MEDASTIRPTDHAKLLEEICLKKKNKIYFPTRPLLGFFRDGHEKNGILFPFLNSEIFNSF